MINWGEDRQVSNRYGSSYHRFLIEKPPQGMTPKDARIINDLRLPNRSVGYQHLWEYNCNDQTLDMVFFCR